MADLIFEDPRLVSIYDAFDGQRKDLVHYVALAEELNAKSVLDIGCGTGCLAELLASKGIQVVGVEPAKASLDFARTKLAADKVRWILRDATKLPPLSVDLAVMTGNVAQVFVTDESWKQTLAGIHRSIHKNGFFVFEVRDPSQKAWLHWTKEETYQRTLVPKVGYVECWCDLVDVRKDVVSFRWTYNFESDGANFVSDSTLRFRERREIEASLIESGFAIKEVRDAPDRPGKEFVFIATAT